MSLPAGEFYETYHGHTVAHLERLHGALRGAGASRFIFLAGDSSLDNKHWFFSGFASKSAQVRSGAEFVGDAVNGYERVLTPAVMVKDVCYWLNLECSQRCGANAPRICAINTAVEESCLSQREAEGLLPQDVFIRDNIAEEDVLIVDVGGNDVALRPTAGVIFNMATLIYLTPTFIVNNTVPPGLLYFIHMFRVRLRSYIEALIAVKKPKKIVVCMLYFLDQRSGGSWADGVLKQLGYDENPAKLQEIIRKVYKWGVSGIQIPGVQVEHLPLYEVLDGTDTTDYVQRVEPSVTGGQKMARAMAEKVFASTASGPFF